MSSSDTRLLYGSAFNCRDKTGADLLIQTPRMFYAHCARRASLAICLRKRERKKKNDDRALAIIFNLHYRLIKRDTICNRPRERAERKKRSTLSSRDKTNDLSSLSNFRIKKKNSAYKINKLARIGRNKRGENTQRIRFFLCMRFFFSLFLVPPRAFFILFLDNKFHGSFARSVV